MPVATLHDGDTIDIDVAGSGVAFLLPVNPRPVEGPAADEMRAWGADPALGQALVEGLRDRCRVAAFDYEGQLSRAPKPDTLTPQNVAADFQAVADAAGMDRFAYYGYSWLGLAGLQLALRSDRLTGLAVGGFPPLGGPYADMLKVTKATRDLAANPPPAPVQPTEPGDWSAVSIALSEAQTLQYVTLYSALESFDDRAVLDAVRCPRLCFAGSADEIDYGEGWGDTHVSIGGALARHRRELERAGWTVRLLDGLDHLQAMQAAIVLPLLGSWLETVRGAGDG
ncbi:MAG: alpha/beta fold hydrolase [Candidatus Dormibacteraceae bacterium]